MRISVYASRELQAVLATTRALPKELASQLNKATKTVAAPVWTEEIRKRASTPVQAKVIAATAVVSVTRANIRLQAGRKGRALSGGGTPPELIKGAEFGAGRRSKQFGPRNLKGNTAYPAAAKVIPRIASLWVQTTYRTVYEAIEK